MEIREAGMSESDNFMQSISESPKCVSQFSAVGQLSGVAVQLSSSESAALIVNLLNALADAQRAQQKQIEGVAGGIAMLAGRLELLAPSSAEVEMDAVRRLAAKAEREAVLARAWSENAQMLSALDRIEKIQILEVHSEILNVIKLQLAAEEQMKLLSEALRETVIGQEKRNGELQAHLCLNNSRLKAIEERMQQPTYFELRLAAIEKALIDLQNAPQPARKEKQKKRPRRQNGV
jgi:hypothetical protein